MFKYILGIVLAASAFTATAQTNRSTGTIEKVSNYEGHLGPLIKLSNMASSEGSCQRNDWYILEPTHKFYEQNYSAILAAKFAGAQVTILSDEGDCVQNFPRLKHLNF